MEKTKIITALAALAQESRLDVFRVLVQAGSEGLAAGKISEITGIAPSSLSFHLKELLYANLVSSRSVGRFIIYSAQFSTMNQLLAYLTENCCAGSACLETPCCTAKENQL